MPRDLVGPFVVTLSCGEVVDEVSVTEMSICVRRYPPKVVEPALRSLSKDTRTSSVKRDCDLRSGYVEAMLKRFFELLGLGTMAVGMYFVLLEHQKNNVCNQTEGKFVGFGVTAQCQHVIYTYFGGFILLALGTLVVLFGLLATRKAAKRQTSARHRSLASQYHLTDPKSGLPPRS